MPNAFISVLKDEVEIRGIDRNLAFYLTLTPEQAMSLVTALLDASKAAASNIPGERIWGTVTNRFLDPEYQEKVEGALEIYS